MAKRKYETYASNAGSNIKYKKRSYEELLDYYTEKIVKSVYRYRKTRTESYYRQFEKNEKQFEKSIRKKLEQEYTNLPLKTPNRWRTAYYSQFASYTQISYMDAMGSANHIIDYLEGVISLDEEWRPEEEKEFRIELQQWVNGIIPTGKMTKERAIANVIFNQGPAYTLLQSIINKYFPEDTSVVRIFYS